MAIVTIGGTEYQVSELNFIALERAWPHIEMAMISQDPMSAVSAAIGAIAAGIMEEEYFKLESFDVDESKFKEFLDRDAQIHEQVVRYLKRKTKATEIAGIRAGLQAIAKEAGLEPETGEAQEDPAVAATSPSTETSDASLQSSLPLDAKEEAGTE